MRLIHWRDLIVTDNDGKRYDTLGNVVSRAPADLDTALIEGGAIKVWPAFFLSAPGEEPAHDTPRGPVEWGGFTASLGRASSVKPDEK